MAGIARPSILCMKIDLATTDLKAHTLSGQCLILEADS